MATIKVLSLAIVLKTLSCLDEDREANLNVVSKLHKLGNYSADVLISRKSFLFLKD